MVHDVHVRLDAVHGVGELGLGDLLALDVLHFKLRHSDGPPLRHADGDQTVLATGHSALDKHEVLLSINADNGEVLHSHAGVAHVTGHLDALEDAGRVAHWPMEPG